MLRCCGERNTARKIGEALITEKLAQTLMNEVELALKKRRLGPDETRLRCRREGSKRMALEIDINDVKKFEKCPSECPERIKFGHAVIREINS